VEIAYFLIHREIINGIAEKPVVTARERGESRLDSILGTIGDDDDTGLPSWITDSGILPADGSSPLD